MTLIHTKDINNTTSLVREKIVQNQSDIILKKKIPRKPIPRIIKSKKKILPHQIIKTHPKPLMKVINEFLQQQISHREIDPIQKKHFENLCPQCNNVSRCRCLRRDGEEILRTNEICFICKQKNELPQQIKVVAVIQKTTPSTEIKKYCPHCNQEIHEKSMFGKQVNDDWYFYHRPCMDKDPIEKVSIQQSKEMVEKLWGMKS